MEELIKNFIESEIRPKIQAHQGDIHFVSYSNNIVTVSLFGACINCPIAFYTLKKGVLQALQAKFPEIRDVVQV